MTQKDSPQDFDPKHRIIGAIVIVALAVIFVPMILSQRGAAPETSSAPATPALETAAENENKVAVTKVPSPATAPVMPEESAKLPATVVETPKTPSVPPSPAPVRSEPAKSAPTEPKPAAPVAKAAVSSEPKSRVSSGWVVQVGTFANAANATKLEQKLRAGGQPVHAERVQLHSGKAVRLRVGPFRDRAAAQKAQERIQKDVGVKGVVLAYP